MSYPKIEFPQPLVTAPDKGYEYWFVTIKNGADYLRWEGDSVDKGILAAGNCYATQEDAKRRYEWNIQEMARLVVPAWFRALGPEVEGQMCDGSWRLLELPFSCNQWDQMREKDFRAKPKPPDVAKIINGVEYRWPATVTRNEPRGLRYTVSQNGEIDEHNNSSSYGRHIHLTRQAAETQVAALKAFWE